MAQCSVKRSRTRDSSAWDGRSRGTFDWYKNPFQGYLLRDQREGLPHAIIVAGQMHVVLPLCSGPLACCDHQSLAPGGLTGSERSFPFPWLSARQDRSSFSPPPQCIGFCPYLTAPSYFSLPIYQFRLQSIHQGCLGHRWAELWVYLQIHRVLLWI